MKNKINILINQYIDVIKKKIINGNCSVENIQVIFEYLGKMIQEPEVKRARIGFRRKDELS